MPIVRDEDKTYQHDLSEFHYGALPLEGLPTLSGSNKIAYWDGTQWHAALLASAGNVEINWDADSSTLEFFFGDSRVAFTFEANAVIQRTEQFGFLAQAELV